MEVILKVPILMWAKPCGMLCRFFVQIPFEEHLASYHLELCSRVPHARRIQHYVSYHSYIDGSYYLTVKSTSHPCRARQLFVDVLHIAQTSCILRLRVIGRWLAVPMCCVIRRFISLTRINLFSDILRLGRSYLSFLGTIIALVLGAANFNLLHFPHCTTVIDYVDCRCHSRPSSRADCAIVKNICMYLCI